MIVVTVIVGTANIYNKAPLLTEKEQYLSFRQELLFNRVYMYLKQTLNTYKTIFGLPFLSAQTVPHLI